jgi:hypothetical protein
MKNRHDLNPRTQQDDRDESSDGSIGSEERFRGGADDVSDTTDAAGEFEDTDERDVEEEGNQGS